MARGWESKAVEAQVEEATESASRNYKRRTPARIEADQKKRSLLLSRSRILQDIDQSNNARYKKMLTDALADLDEKIAQLD